MKVSSEILVFNTPNQNGDIFEYNDSNVSQIKNTLNSLKQSKVIDEYSINRERVTIIKTI